MRINSVLKGLLPVLALFLSTPGSVPAQAPAPACSQCATWNIPQAPFKIYANTYYVGTHGLSSILISTDAGLVLIDGALSNSVPQIVTNLKSLGFRIEDVNLILNSHVHYDHAGGIAELQHLSGAKVYASPWTAAAMKTGASDREDPQYGTLPPITPVANLQTLHDGQTLQLGKLAITAHFTPGHTPGGTSWTWQSCEAGSCQNIVYADSLSPVSSPAFKFTQTSEYPHALAGFETSFAFLNTTPCDILLTPHPEVSNLWDRLEKLQQGVKPNPMIDPTACKRLADQSRETLKKRVAEETAAH
jgi:metallo-beta-lactamase class B